MAGVALLSAAGGEDDAGVVQEPRLTHVPNRCRPFDSGHQAAALQACESGASCTAPASASASYQAPLGSCAITLRLVVASIHQRSPSGFQELVGNIERGRIE